MCSCRDRPMWRRMRRTGHGRNWGPWEAGRYGICGRASSGICGGGSHGLLSHAERICRSSLCPRDRRNRLLTGVPWGEPAASTSLVDDYGRAVGRIPMDNPVHRLADWGGGPPHWPQVQADGTCGQWSIRRNRGFGIRQGGPCTISRLYLSWKDKPGSKVGRWPPGQFSRAGQV